MTTMIKDWYNMIILDVCDSGFTENLDQMDICKVFSYLSLCKDLFNDHQEDRDAFNVCRQLNEELYSYVSQSKSGVHPCNRKHIKYNCYVAKSIVDYPDSEDTCRILDQIRSKAPIEEIIHSVNEYALKMIDDIRNTCNKSNHSSFPFHYEPADDCGENPEQVNNINLNIPTKESSKKIYARDTIELSDEVADAYCKEIFGDNSHASLNEFRRNDSNSTFMTDINNEMRRVEAERLTRKIKIGPRAEMK